MNLRISHYTEDTLGGMVGAIVCFYRDRLIHVKPGDMPIWERRTEWVFGNICEADNIICTVRCDNGQMYFQQFRPDLNQLSKETAHVAPLWIPHHRSGCDR